MMKERSPRQRPKIKIIQLKVGEPPQTVEIDNKLEAMQRLVGGYIEAVRVEGSLFMICNEDGKRSQLPTNFTTASDYIVGDVFFTRSSNAGDNIDVTDKDEQTVTKLLRELGRLNET